MNVGLDVIGNYVVQLFHTNTDRFLLWPLEYGKRDISRLPIIHRTSFTLENQDEQQNKLIRNKEKMKPDYDWSQNFGNWPVEII